MNSIIEQMLEKYDAKNTDERRNALKEVIQEITLCGLSRAGFFKKAAFYGGTALRIFYNLDRFSEDLDFSLMEADKYFTLTKYFPILEKEIRSYGFNVSIDIKGKTVDSDIQSAFLKGNTKEHIFMFYPDDFGYSSIPKNEVLRVKFEVDVNPPRFATFEHKYRLQPVPYEVNMYDESSLFAGKIHAVLCRGWKSRIKGRDLYDYVFYLSRNIPVNIKHLKERLIQSKIILKDGGSLNEIKEMLCNKFSTIDYTNAKQDVAPFIKDISKLELWSTDFFCSITNDLKSI
ncbi:MAG: nucleotidyl transferase AbiEii/AbiGii toxin family protein [Suipraeoptans sp.]